MTRGAIIDRAPTENIGENLLVLLPGAGMTAEDFRSHRFIETVRHYSRPIDVLLADTGVDFYLEKGVALRLRDQIIRPQGSQYSDRLWLAGISLGGLGALLSAQAYPQEIDGLLLIAPFIGSRGLIAEIKRAGGLRAWEPGETATPERSLLTWFKSYSEQAAGYSRIHLAYGTEDRYSGAYHHLADLLPKDKTVTRPGGHDWPTWERLWDDLVQIMFSTASDFAQALP